MTFNYNTQDGTATTAGNDYTASSGSDTIPAGSTSVTLPNVTTETAGAGDYFSMTLSSLGNAEAGTITATASLIAAAAPPNVAGLEGVAQSTSRIDLSWNSGGGTTTGYEIAYQSGTTAPANCSSGTDISSTSISGDEYDVTGLSTSTKYSFRVCAVNTDGLVSAGATVTVKTLSSTPGTLPPPDVENLEASVISTFEIDLAWTSGGGTTASFEIAYETGATAPTNCASGTVLTTASLTEPVTGLTGGTEYSFRVCAVDSTGAYVSIGQTVSATTPTIDAITVSDLMATATSTTSFTAALDYTGDTNANSTATLYYCDNTNSAGCSPTGGTSVAMTEGAGIYSATVTGLTSPINPGDVLNIEVEVSDADGVTGSPLTTSVTLVTYEIVFTTEPSTSVTLGSTLAQGPAVQVEDSLGHFVTSGPYGSATITLSDTSGNGDLSGTTTETASNGAATFANNSIQFEKGGTTSLTATMTPTDYPSITGASSTITVTIPTMSAVSSLTGYDDPNGDVDGNGTSAKFWYPGGIVSDGTYIYIMEGLPACVIRRYEIASPYTVTTWTGQLYNCGATDGAVGTNTLDSPFYPGMIQMTTDGTNIYFIDGHSIRMASISNGTITTIAGSSSNPGYTDSSTGTSALFNSPLGLYAYNGTLYVGDTGNCVIRAVSLTSPYAVTTYAGDGACGEVDNPKASAELDYVSSITGDSTNLYFVDTNITSVNEIREINWSSGAVTTADDIMNLSGNCGAEYDAIGVIGTSMYLACNSEINESTIGTWSWAPVTGTTVWNGQLDGSSSVSSLGSSVAIYPVGTNIYVADTSHGTLRVLDDTNTFTTVAGDYVADDSWTQNTSAANTRFGALADIISDGTYIYGFDAEFHQVAVISMSNGSSGSPITEPSAGVPLGQDAARIGSTIYFHMNCEIYTLDTSTGTYAPLVGSSSCSEAEGGFSTARFKGITSIVTDQKNLYVFDNDAVKEVNLTAQTVSVLSGDAGHSGCTLGTESASRYASSIAGMAYLNGEIYFSQALCNNNQIVQVSTTTGASVAFAGNGTAGAVNSTLLNSEFGNSDDELASLPITTDGVNLYVYDWPNGLVRELNASGVTTLFGSTSQMWDVDGSLSTATAGTINTTITWGYEALYYAYGKLYIAEPRGIRVAQ